MIRYGVIEPLLLGFIALIFEALPLPAPFLEALSSTAAARAPRQVLDGTEEPETTIQSGGIFKVFPNKNRVELRPNGPVAPLGYTRSPQRRPTAEQRAPSGEGDGDGNPEGASSGGDPGGASGGGSPGGASDGGSPGGASDGGSPGGKHHTNAQKELIVTYKSFQTNAMGDVIRKQVQFDTGPFEKLIKNPVKNYFPSMKNLSTVCMSKSTIYNEYKIEKWLMRGLNSKKKSSRPMLMKLRREIYDKGKSEMCHTMNLTDWQKYQECAIRRNQRMEYLIPNYPQQQVVSD